MIMEICVDKDEKVVQTRKYYIQNRMNLYVLISAGIKVNM